MITFGVIGYGRFGKFWTKRLLALGKTYVFEPRKDKQKPKGRISAQSLEHLLSKKIDILFLAMPISQIEKVCKDIRGLLNPKTLVADVCSVKVYPSQVMKKILPKNLQLIGIHPLFGPDSAGNTKTLKGFKIVVCPLRVNKKKLTEFIKILKSTGAGIIFTTPEKHDRQMANSQALIHFIGRGIENLNLRPQKIATKDYESLLHIKDMVVHDSRRLFFDMHNFNPFAKKLRKKLLSNLREVEFRMQTEAKDLNSLRNVINNIDGEIIQLLSNRFKIAKYIGQLKNTVGKKIFDADREKKLAKDHERLGRRLNINQRLLNEIFNLVIKESKKLQQ